MTKPAAKTTARKRAPRAAAAAARAPMPPPDQRRGLNLDGWSNALTGLGQATIDKRLGACVTWEPMTEAEAEELYAADDVASTVVDVIPEDGLRQWLTFHVPGDDDAPKAIKDALDELGARQKLLEVWKWGRMYGGAAVLMLVDDSRDLADPLDLGAIRSVRNLVVLTRWELFRRQLDLDIMSPRYGQPITYGLSPHRGGSEHFGQEIHHTRLLRFEGVKLPPRLHVRNYYWGDSVLNRLQNAIRNYNTAHDSGASIMQEFNQPVFKIKGLAEMLGNDQEGLLVKRFQALQLARSICRALIVDGDEDFQNVTAQLTGVPDMLRMAGSRLVVGARMPHTKLLGESPSGLGATGDSENRDWYDHVANQQEIVLRPAVKRLAEVLMAARRGPTGGQIPDGWGFEFDALAQMSETESAALRKTQAETDQIYLSTGVLDPPEVAISRFGGGKYSTETTIDLESRELAAPGGDDTGKDEPTPPAEGDDGRAAGGAA